jgi:hypothetical protein
MSAEGEERDFPPLTPGATVLVQLRNRRYYSEAEDGTRTEGFLGSRPQTMVVRDREACFTEDWAEDYDTIEDAMHVHTICVECAPEWAIDHYVTLVEAG